MLFTVIVPIPKCWVTRRDTTKKKSLTIPRFNEHFRCFPANSLNRGFGGPYKHNVYLTEFKLTRTKKAQAIAALIKICTALINRTNFNTFRTTTKKLTTQTKLEHNKKEVQTLISLKFVFASLIKIIMSNLQQWLPAYQ